MKKVTLFILLSIAFAGYVTAQVKTGDFIRVSFGDEQKIYTAEISSVTGTSFSCRFLHTQSTYVFKNLREGETIYDFTAVVESTKGGGYQKGTNALFYIYRPDYKKEVTSSNYNDYLEKNKHSNGQANIIAKFPDGLKYMANIKKSITADNTIVSVFFTHTSSVYTINIADGKVVESGGAYKKGTKVQFFECQRIAHDGVTVE